MTNDKIRTYNFKWLKKKPKKLDADHASENNQLILPNYSINDKTLWQPNTQYIYKYSRRTIANVYEPRTLRLV